jgi:hypothetical protein
MAIIEQYVVRAGLLSPGSSGNATSISAELAARLIPLILYAEMVPSQANLSAPDGILTTAMRNRRM